MSDALSLHPGALEALVDGAHGAPFTILGPHAHPDGVLVRAFEPGAVNLELVALDGSAAIHPMRRLHPAGVFELLLPGATLESLRYELRVTWGDGSSRQQPDLYAFPATLSDYDHYLLTEGTDLYAYQKLGAHPMRLNGYDGVRFAVWAPNARRVSVIGNFNQWDGRRHLMHKNPGSGIWELFIPGLEVGATYKYEVRTFNRGVVADKADPYAFYSEVRPNNASIVWRLDQYAWGDEAWLAQRHQRHSRDAPISVYELHIGSWQRLEGNAWLSYRDLIDRLIPYLQRMGYTHVELLPVAEHPYDGSWGYQVTGYFAPTSRHGAPEDFMAFVDACHQAGIGVILDWVPAHFPTDGHGLAYFDGSHLYEHADPRQGFHPDWGTFIFNYGRNEVRQFLISNALFWLDQYHIDGLRVDAVASMLYLDFSREPGQWVPNIHGGRENLDAIDFVRDFNRQVHDKFPDVLTIAEESTAWPGVTAPIEQGGLGFDFKWNMGWMHDTLRYMSMDPIFRAYHHGTLTFSLLYAFSEKFMLPFSHDEVVHLKKSMISKMPGDVWQKFANLRALYAYQFSHPGKKLLFMGGEFGQWREWTEAYSLDWHLVTDGSYHAQLQDFVAALNHLYVTEKALHEDDYSWQGFQWMEVHDSAHSILAYARRAITSADTVVVVSNFTPVVRAGYRLGVPEGGVYTEVLNSDDPLFGGSGVIDGGDLTAEATAWRGQPFSLVLTLPPLGVIFLKRQTPADDDPLPAEATPAADDSPSGT